MFQCLERLFEERTAERNPFGLLGYFNGLRIVEIPVPELVLAKGDIPGP
jgi:hypothetical protein